MTTAPVNLTRRPQDLIESFLEYTEGIASPYIFRLWSAIALVGGLLERRVYVETAGERLYPNLYTLLVAPPGVGKTQAIKITKAIWQKTPDLVLSPDNVTKAALIDSLAKASRKIVKSPTDLIEFNSMQIAADELGVFMSAHDLDFLSAMNKIYDCPSEYKEDRRMFKEPLVIHEPQINLLSGTQPGFMGNVFPEEAWTMGFTSRLIMVFSATPVKVKLFSATGRDDGLYKGIVNDAKAIMQLFGKFKWEASAAAGIEDWHEHGAKATEPQHTKLEHYLPRRIIHVLKLCMISSASRSNDMIIRETDFHRAVSWLLEAERTMPEIFRTMTAKSDAVVIQELHFHLWTLYSKEKKEIHESRLIHFLQTRVPSERVMRVLEIAERSGIITRMAGSTLYKPAAKGAQGLE